MKNKKILLIEDNEGDILLTKEAIEYHQHPHHLDVIKNGSDVKVYFNKLLSEANAQLPDLIFLDINLPKMNGQEVLHFLKSEPAIKHIPVIMLTTSSSQKDILSSYQNGANSYITKPVDVHAFMDSIAKVQEYWYEVSKIPNH